MAEKALGERVHAVAAGVVVGVERVGNEHDVVDRRKRDAALSEDQHVELDVQPDLENARRLQERLQERDRFGFRHLVGRGAASAEEIVGADPVPDRDVAGFARLDRDRYADELRLHGIGRRGLGVDGDEALLVRARDPGAEIRRGPHDLIGAVVERSARLARAGADEIGGRRAFGNCGRPRRRRRRGALGGA